MVTQHITGNPLAFCGLGDRLSAQPYCLRNHIIVQENISYAGQIPCSLYNMTFHFTGAFSMMSCDAKPVNNKSKRYCIKFKNREPKVQSVKSGPNFSADP